MKPPGMRHKEHGMRSERAGAMSNPQSGERLQKILAHAGVASRRAAEELIAAGRVSVNGQVVREMGVRADPQHDTITLDGKPIQVQPHEDAEHLVYIALNKPAGVVSTVTDTHGRPTVIDLVRKPVSDEQHTTGESARKTPESEIENPKSKIGRVYPVGRLDVETAGLLLLTNDGELTFRLTHPRYGIEKKYRALVRGRVGEATLRRLREGIEIEGGVTAPAKVEHLGESGPNTLLLITIHEGRKRQIRLMLAAVGHPVIELQRTRIGPIQLGTLAPGKWRYLAVHEVHALRKAVNLEMEAKSKFKVRRSKFKAQTERRP